MTSGPAPTSGAAGTRARHDAAAEERLFSLTPATCVIVKREAYYVRGTEYSCTGVRRYVPYCTVRTKYALLRTVSKPQRPHGISATPGSVRSLFDRRPYGDSDRGGQASSGSRTEPSCCAGHATRWGHGAFLSYSATLDTEQLFRTPKAFADVAVDMAVVVPASSGLTPYDTGGRWVSRRTVEAD